MMIFITKIYLLFGLIIYSMQTVNAMQQQQRQQEPNDLGMQIIRERIKQIMKQNGPQDIKIHNPFMQNQAMMQQQLQQQKNNRPVVQPVQQQSPVPVPIKTPQPELVEVIIPEAPYRGPELLKGSIIIEGMHDAIPQYRLYYQGMRTENDESGDYSFPIEDRVLSDYYIVIAKNLTPLYSHVSSLDQFMIKSKHDYKVFKMISTGPNAHEWKIKPQVSTDNFIIPEKTLLMMENPRYFKRLDPRVVKLNRSTIPVPTFIFDGSYYKKFVRHAVKSQLYSLDVRRYTQPIKPRFSYDSPKTRRMLPS